MTLRRICASLLMIGLLSLTGLAGAQSRSPGSRTINGVSKPMPIVAVDLGADTVTVGTQTYQVTEDSVIVDDRGGALRLRDIRPGPPADGKPVLRMGRVQSRSGLQANRPVIVRLTVTQRVLDR